MLVGYTVSMAKIIISLPDDLLSKVDAYCVDNEYNRSEFIRHAMRAVLNNPTREIIIKQDGWSAGGGGISHGS